jgi:hypothetical protein
MTRKREDGSVQIEATPAGVCELCAKKAELRPYGPRGESICFECGMKDEATTKRQFARVLGIDNH